jgi:membrane protein insertase Oxa1/YidC/SpoIIIJ
MFYSMPAGLTLYWTVNQVLTIVQNLVSQKMEKAAAGNLSTANGSAK